MQGGMVIKMAYLWMNLNKHLLNKTIIYEGLKKLI